MTAEVWIQPALFPEYPQIFWAYEIESHGTYWEVFDDGDTMIGYYEPEDFGDFLDFARSIHYDVLINTQESWEALINEY